MLAQKAKNRLIWSHWNSIYNLHHLNTSPTFITYLYRLHISPTYITYIYHLPTSPTFITYLYHLPISPTYIFWDLLKRAFKHKLTFFVLNPYKIYLLISFCLIIFSDLRLPRYLPSSLVLASNQG